MAGVAVSRQLWSWQSKQTNKKLKQKEAELGVLQAKLRKVLYALYVMLPHALHFFFDFVRCKGASP
jgi:hypothetical protein